MTATLLTPILIILVALFVFIGVMRGYKKGAVRSAVGMAVLVASAFLGAGLAILLSGLLYNPILLILYNTGAFGAISSTMGSFTTVILIVIAMAATLICFLPCFLVVYLILMITVRIIIRIRAGKAMKETDEFFSEDDDYLVKRDKRIGAMIGAASALFVSIAILGPITGIFKAASGTVNVVSEATGMATESMAPVVQDLVKYSDDTAVTVIDACGGRMWFNMATTAYCYGNFTNVNKELKLLNEIGTKELSDIMQSIGKLDEESLSAFEDLMKKIDKSPIMKLVLTISVNDMSSSWLANREYMGAKRPAIGNDYIEDFVDDMLRVLRTSTIYTVNDDVTTMLRVASILREYEEIFATENYAEMADLLSEGDLVDRLKHEIRKNKRMLTLEQTIDDILMRAFTEEISDFTRFSFEDREQLYSKLADILTSSIGLTGGSRVSAVAEDISNALDEYGVYAPEGMDTQIAEMLISGVQSSGSTVSMEDVSTYFEAYMGASASALK